MYRAPGVARTSGRTPNCCRRPDIVKTEPQPSDREVLAGLVERVTYQNAENGFCVIRVKARGHAISSRWSATLR